MKTIDPKLNGNGKCLTYGRYKRLKNNLRVGTLFKTEFGSFIVEEIFSYPGKNQRFKSYQTKCYFIENNEKDLVILSFADGVVRTGGYGWVEDFIL